MNKYTMVIEQTGNNYAGYVPDLPGCIATGQTPEETVQLLKEGIDIYIKELEAKGLPIPTPTTDQELAYPA